MLPNVFVSDVDVTMHLKPVSICTDFSAVYVFSCVFVSARLG